jgi:DNA-binding CsgD family transcriptional regulator
LIGSATLASPGRVRCAGSAPASCRAHDYSRHSFTSLFAALDIATGRVIGTCYPWTPEHLRPRSPRWPRRDHLIRPSSAARWSNWCYIQRYIDSVAETDPIDREDARSAKGKSGEILSKGEIWGNFISYRSARARARFDDILTQREQEVMFLVAKGLANRKIAKRLGVSEGTVKIHLHHIYKKLSVSNRTALANLVHYLPRR